MRTETTPTVESDDQYKIALTIKEAAYASGISRSLLYIAIGQGALRARKFGARTLILDADLRRFLRGLPHFAKKAPAPQPRPVRLRKGEIGGREHAA
jgi:excisionase family DNA binding protein